MNGPADAADVATDPTTVPSRVTAATTYSGTPAAAVAAAMATVKGDPPGQRQLPIDGLTRLVGVNQGPFVVRMDWRAGGGARFSQSTLGSHWDPVYAGYIAAPAAELSVESDAFCDHLVRDASAMQELRVTTPGPLGR